MALGPTQGDEKVPSVRHPLSLEASPSPLSSRLSRRAVGPKRTQISYLATLITATHAAFRREGAQSWSTPPSSTGNLGERSGPVPACRGEISVLTTSPGNVFRQSVPRSPASPHSQRQRTRLSFKERSQALHGSQTAVQPCLLRTPAQPAKGRLNPVLPQQKQPPLFARDRAPRERLARLPR